MADKSSNKNNGSARFKAKQSDTTSSLNLGGKVPPFSMEAEQAVIGAMLLDKIAISKVTEIVSSDSFYNTRHEIIFRTIMELNEPNIGVDLVTLSDRLRRNNLLEEVGGTAYIVEIMSKTPSAANVEFHAQIVQERYLKRKLIEAAGRIITGCYEESTDAFEEIDSAESEIYKIAEERIKKSYLPLSDLAHDAWEIIEQLHLKDKLELTGIPTGYIDLDKLLGGFQNSDLIILAGRPSMGKTALALSIARNIAKEYQVPTAFFSIEMSAIQLVIRLISAEAQIDQHSIRTGNAKKKLDVILKHVGKLARIPLFIDDSPMLSLLELRAKCRRMVIEHGIKIVFIDYLQLMHPPKAESREREISIISRSLKQLAKELKIPIIALAQLNRSVESRADKRPILSDLRESGSIEQDADVVMFVNRPEVYGIQTYEDKSPTENTAEVIVGKQRNGPIGTIKLAYRKDFARFENLAYHYIEQAHNLVPAEESDDDGPGF